MTKNYAPIPQMVITQPTAITQPSHCYVAEIHEDSSAFKVMSDLKLAAPAATSDTSSVKHANQQMIDRAVRMLLVVDDMQQLIGLITNTDLLGEKPHKHMQDHRCSTHDIQVKDLMTPIDGIKVLDYSDIERAKVGDIIATLKQNGHEHVLIADYQDDGTLSICGIFSLSHINQMMNSQIAASSALNFVRENRQPLHH